MTLSNVDALDATTEATIEAAIDTLANLGSMGANGSELEALGSLDVAQSLKIANSAFADASRNVTAGTIAGSTGTFSGKLITDDATEATSATDGSLQTDGGLSVVKSAVIGDDLDLLSNSAVFKVGSDQPFTLTHSNASNTLMASANHRLAFGDAGEYLTGDGTNLSVISSGDLILDPGGNNVLPGSDSADSLGADGTAWAKLYVDDIDLNGQGRIDLNASANCSIRSAADDSIEFEISGTDKFGMIATAFLPVTAGSVDLGSTAAEWGDIYVADDKKLKFGSDQDATIEYDEDGTNELRFAGAAATFEQAVTFDGAVTLGNATGDTITVLGNSTFVGTTIANLGTVSAATSITATDLVGTNVDGIIGADTARAGTFTTLDCTDGAFAVANLDIDGATDIGAALVDADLVMVDDGGGGTNRKCAMSRVKTYLASTKQVKVFTAELAANAAYDTGMTTADFDARCNCLWRWRQYH